MKIKKTTIFLWIFLIFWVILIFSLSTQNGEQTSNTSIKIAEKASEIIYSAPTQNQIHTIHMLVRSMAHVFLFFMLGVLVFFSITSIFNITSLSKVAIISLIISISIGFIDEWQKQFISGRHFHIKDVLINFFSSFLGIAASIVLISIYKKLFSDKK